MKALMIGLGLLAATAAAAQQQPQFLGTHPAGNALQLTLAKFTDVDGVTPVLPERLLIQVDRIEPSTNVVTVLPAFVENTPTDPYHFPLPETVGNVVHPDLGKAKLLVTVRWCWGGCPATKVGTKYYTYNVEKFQGGMPPAFP